MVDSTSNITSAPLTLFCIPQCKLRNALPNAKLQALAIASKQRNTKLRGSFSSKTELEGLQSLQTIHNNRMSTSIYVPNAVIIIP